MARFLESKLANVLRRASNSAATHPTNPDVHDESTGLPTGHAHGPVAWSVALGVSARVIDDRLTSLRHGWVRTIAAVATAATAAAAAAAAASRRRTRNGARTQLWCAATSLLDCGIPTGSCTDDKLQTNPPESSRDSSIERASSFAGLSSRFAHWLIHLVSIRPRSRVPTFSEGFSTIVASDLDLFPSAWNISSTWQTLVSDHTECVSAFWSS